jgi:FAD/FMN-containing dehydrogenase
MRSHVSGMAYQNYIDHDLRDWRKAYYGSNYNRLVGIQRQVDPHHYFNFAQAIGH